MKNLRAFQRSQILRQFKWNFSPKMDYLFFFKSRWLLPLCITRIVGIKITHYAAVLKLFILKATGSRKKRRIP